MPKRMWLNNSTELRGDQIDVDKILNGYENIDRSIFLSLKQNSRNRGHEVTLVYIGYQEVLVLIQDNKLMEQIIYRLCNC